MKKKLVKSRLRRASAVVALSALLLACGCGSRLYELWQPPGGEPETPSVAAADSPAGGDPPYDAPVPEPEGAEDAEGDAALDPESDIPAQEYPELVMNAAEPAVWQAPPVTLRPELLRALQNGDKLIALTFDDGPYPSGTGNMLELLREQDVKVTFFLIAHNVALYPELARQAAADGHQIGNHSYNHSNLPGLGPDALRIETWGACALIEDVTGVRPALYRPPGGSLNDRLTREIGMPVVLWSVDPRDWATTDADEVFAHVVANARDGDIIILHDIYTSTVDAAAMIIPRLKEDSFFFVTVDELIAVRGELEQHGVYRSLPPRGAPAGAAGQGVEAPAEAHDEPSEDARAAGETPQEQAAQVQDEAVQAQSEAAQAADGSAQAQGEAAQAAGEAAQAQGGAAQG